MQIVAEAADVGTDRGLEVKLGDDVVLLVRDGDRIRAFDGKCPHAGAPLAKGAVCGGRIVCPWHKAMFSLDDGSLLEPPALAGLAQWEVRVEDGHVLVGAKQAPPALPPGDDGRAVLIVGAGAGAAAAAAGLREFGFAGTVTMVGREDRPPYDRTALSKFVMEGGKAPGEVSALLPDTDTLRIAWRQCEVTGLDPAAKRATLADGSAIAFDMALVVTGAAPKRPDLPGMDLPGVHTLRTAADAAAILAGVGEEARAVVLGSSFIGLEVASGLRKRGASVSVVTPEAVPFAKQMGERIGRAFQALHERHGVEFHNEAAVARLVGEGRVARVELEDGSSLPADLVIVGTGVAPETGFLSGVERTEDGGVAVDASMRAADGLWVAGDAARFPFAGETARIEHWRVAQQTARVAAQAMAGLEARFNGVPYFWTYHFGKRFDYLGHPKNWDEVDVDGDLDASDFVALLLKAEEVVGVVACARERAAAAMIVAMRDGLTRARARAIVAASG